MRLRDILLGGAAALLAALGVGAAETPLLVSAAASLRPALEECATRWAATRTEGERVGLVFNFGASGALAAQIRHGAPVDLFIAAGEKPVQALLDAGLASPDAVRRFLGNRLVLIAPAGRARPRDWADLAEPAAGVKHLALGEPGSVPAGAYAQDLLRGLGLWNALEGRRVFAKDVRQVLAYVERGDAEAGVVYATEAAASDKVRVVAEAPPGSHAPITYPAVVPRTSPRAEAARAWLLWLEGAEARAVFVRHGFGVAAVTEGVGE